MNRRAMVVCSPWAEKQSRTAQLCLWRLFWFWQLLALADNLGAMLLAHLCPSQSTAHLGSFEQGSFLSVTSSLRGAAASVLCGRPRRPLAWDSSGLELSDAGLWRGWSNGQQGSGSSCSWTDHVFLLLCLSFSVCKMGLILYLPRVPCNCCLLRSWIPLDKGLLVSSVSCICCDCCS